MVLGCYTATLLLLWSLWSWHTVWTQWDLSLRCLLSESCSDVKHWIPSLTSHLSEHWTICVDDDFNRPAVILNETLYYTCLSFRPLSTFKVAMTWVNLSFTASASLVILVWPLWIASMVKPQSSMVHTACIIHSIPDFSLVFTTSQTLSCKDSLCLHTPWGRPWC